MTFFVLLVSVGLNLVEFSTYDSRQECERREQDVVTNHTGEIDAVCIDVKNNQIVSFAGRSGF